MIYGICCFATLFQFCGTFLAALGDQSWGRFWVGSERNGALIIVLWNALILPSALGGNDPRTRLVVCAIWWDIVTSWSWFGVNMLGSACTATASRTRVKWLVLFVASQLGFIVPRSLPQGVGKVFPRGRKLALPRLCGQKMW